MKAAKRPRSVTVIGFVVLVAGVLGLVVALVWFVGVRISPEFKRVMMLSFSPVTLLWLLVGSPVWIASGSAMLRGRNWGRILYIVYVPASMLLGVFSYGLRARDLFAAAVYVLFLNFLTRPEVGRFFKTRK